MKNNKQTPLVSIVCVTYNQERYITDALESFVAQNADFPIEIIVSDDCSTDSTPDIISNFAKKHPNMRPIFNKQNIGVVNNFYKAIRLAKGDYIALCEGDDFWVNPKKLQRQAEFLEENKSYALCFHPVKVMVDDKIIEGEVYPDRKSVSAFTVDELLKRNFIQTNSVMYRRQRAYPNIPEDVLPVDWYLHIYHAKQGKIGYINTPMAVYRRHPGGIWWKDQENKVDFWQRNAVRHLRLFESMEKLFDDEPEKQEIIRETTRELLNTIGDELDGDSGLSILIVLACSFPNYTALAIARDARENKLLKAKGQQQELEAKLLREEMELLRQDRQNLISLLSHRDAAIREIKNSKSWKITKPIRDLGKLRALRK